MDTPATNSDIEAQAAEMLRRIGWTASDWKQVELYARMPPARKVEQMFRIRRQFMHAFEMRLKREHPELSEYGLKRLIQERLEFVRKDY